MLGFLYTSISKGETLSRSQIIKQMSVDYRLLKHLIEFTYLKVAGSDQVHNKTKEYVVDVVGLNMAQVDSFK